MDSKISTSGDSPAMAVNLSRMQVWMPSPVHALATRPDGKIVAVGREDGDIELAVPSEGYRVEARVPGQKDKGLRSLAWVERHEEQGRSLPQSEAVRLFGCGLDGTVFEVDLSRLCYKNVRDAYGGSAWSMKAAPSLSLLAVGCEDGSVRLFSTEEGGLEFRKSFPSTGSRVLSLAWAAGKDAIFAGCADSLIHCLDASTGQGLFDMRLESLRKEEALVWALEALSDGTVISGDSYGRVKVWDGLTGTQLQSITTHEADVLCLCVAEGQTELFASGCDAKVVSLERRQAFTPDVGEQSVDFRDTADEIESRASTASQRTRQGWEWTLGSMRREHTHDVNALTIHGPTLDGTVEDGGIGAARKGAVLVSAGIDASLALYSVPGFKTQGPRPLEPLPPVGIAMLARVPRLVLVMHNLQLALWQIPRHDKSFSEGMGDLEDGTVLDSDGVGGERGALRLRLSMEPKTEKGGHLACAAISADGKMVAVSNTKQTKLYLLTNISSTDEGPISVKRVRLPGTCSPPAHALAFAADGRRLVIAAAAGDIRVVDLGHVRAAMDEGANMGSAITHLVHCFEEHVDGVRPGGGDEGEVPVSAVTLSATGKWLVSSSVSGVVYVFNLVEMRHHWTLPSFSAHRVVGLRFHCRDDILVCVDSSNALRLLDVQERRLADCHGLVEFPRVPSGKGAWGGEGDVHALAGVAFNPKDPLHSMFLYNNRSVMYVALARKIPQSVLVRSSKNKKQRLNAGGKSVKPEVLAKATSQQSNFRMTRDYSSVVLLDFLGENELLIMENPWETVKEALPDVLDRKQYGV